MRFWLWFERKKNINIEDIWRQRDPELGSRVKNDSAPHGAAVDGQSSEVNRRGGMKSAWTGQIGSTLTAF